MNRSSGKKENTANKPRKRTARVSAWTTRQKLRAAARVGDAAVTTVGDVVLLVLKLVISAVLVLITAGLLFACIFA